METFGQSISAGFKPTKIVAVPNHTISIHFTESNLKESLMVFHLSPFWRTPYSYVDSGIEDPELVSGQGSE
jgi:hypothetical protein